MTNRLPSIILAALACGCWQLPAAEPAAGAVTLRVQSARVSRSATELKQGFGNRYFGENSPGVSLQLLLTLKAGCMLPPERDAVTLDTFVDDTYQNLLAPATDSSYYSGNNQREVSDDGHSLLFTVGTSRPVAEDAGRVFVRGSLRTRFSRGEPKVASSPMMLTVGQGAMVGPFRTVTRSVSETGGGSSSALSLNLSIGGDAQRIRKIRVLDSTGQVLNDERQSRLGGVEFEGRTLTAYVLLRSVPKELVTIEYTYVEATETVRIPFEAQVDIGVAKAGPLEPSEGKSPKQGGAPRDRPWPPLRETPGEALPPRRTAFQPEAQPPVPSKPRSAKVEGAAIDLFSLTVAKPAPSEAKDVKWNCPPAPELFASGFTIARLMLSTPGAAIISIPADGVAVTRFEDDKGGRLGTTLYRDTTSSGSSFPYVRRSPDGEQMLLNLSLASAPTPGATRCTLAGTVQARIGRGDLASTTTKLNLRTERSFTAGPYTGVFNSIRQTPPSSPSTQEGRDVELWLSLNGPVGRVRSVELLDASGTILNPNRTGFTQLAPERAETLSWSMRLTAAPAGPVTLRIRHFESEETIQVPFELKVGVGL